MAVFSESFPPRRALAAQYFTYFGVLGIMLPYFNLYCYHLGMSESDIGVLFGVRSAAIVFMPLIWGALADRYQARKTMFVFANLASTAFFCLYFFAETFWPMLMITLVYALFHAPIIGFQEAFAMEILGGDRNKYGRTRVWGSISFILAVLFLGELIESTSARIILPLILLGSVAQAIFSTRMPAVDGPASKERRPLFSGAMHFSNARVKIFFFASFLMLASHGAYYGFFSIHLENLGFSDGFIGLAWALGTLAEVGVMLYGHRILQRFDPMSVLCFSLFAAVFRWILLAFISSGAALLAAQFLHAATYGTFHVASILTMDRLIPRQYRTMGQTANNAITYGLGLTAGSLASGYLFDHGGAATAFLMSASLALLGFIVFSVSLINRNRCSP